MDKATAGARYTTQGESGTVVNHPASKDVGLVPIA
jgi:hypothetical protein